MSKARNTNETLIPEADHEIVSLLEENGQEKALRNITSHKIKTSEFRGEYDIGFSRNSKTRLHSGTYFSPEEISPYYSGMEEELGIEMETEIEEFYASLNGEFRIVDSEGEARKYKLVMSCEDGIILKGEIGYNERETAEIRYERKPDGNELQIMRNGRVENYGKLAKGEGKEGSVRQHVEFIESVYRKLIKPEISEPERNGIKIQNYSEAEARQDLKLLDKAFRNLRDSTVETLTDFEDKEEARVNCQDHPFNTLRNTSTEGAKGRDAAKKMISKFTKLNQTGIIDYKVRLGGGYPSADIEIKEDLSESIRTVSDYECSSDLDQNTREKIVEDRFEN